MKTTMRFIFSLLTIFGLLAVSPDARAVVPPPDGGYPGGNTAEGQNALLNLTSGGYNTAVGFVSLASDTTGSLNTGIGAASLFVNTGDNNTAIGALALLNNTGDNNAATGAGALLSNTGNENTANGTFALINNTTGVQNTAVGYSALFDNTTAGANSSGANTAIGAFALGHTVIGGANTAVGYAALFNATGGGNIALGDLAGVDVTTGSGNIIIGDRGLAGDDATIRIGNFFRTACYIGGIAGNTVGIGGTACYVDNDGKLGVFLSARRFKIDIADMGAASEALLALHPVTFRYKPELDKAGIPQFGLVAEEVAEVNPDLVTRDKEGKVSTVRYEAINAMLLNEFLKEHKKVEKLEATVADLVTQLREVSAQLQMNNSPARVVVNQ